MSAHFSQLHYLILQQDSSVRRWNPAKLVKTFYIHFWWNNVFLINLRWLNRFYHWTSSDGRVLLIPWCPKIAIMGIMQLTRDLLVIILIEPCRKVLPAPHFPEHSQKPLSPSMGTILWLIAITSFILWFRQRTHKSKFPLPPGPPADPIIGHLRYIPPENPEGKIAEWSRQYGVCFWALVCETGWLSMFHRRCHALACISSQDDHPQ